MCGISGYFSFNKKIVFNENDLNTMKGSMHHRGPDSNGTFYSEICGLAHNRLSILDLSSNGNQPMHSHDQRYVIVYNGEVYNFNEIASELKQTKNIEFKSNSDTEIILEAFAAYGKNFIHKLNGMFAIAIYDKSKEELHIFRDRAGIKPLYYYWDKSCFVFASEIQALSKINKLSLQINQNAIHHFLHLGYIPAPLSIYSNIHKLKPGHYLKINTTHLSIEKYWSLSSHIYEDTHRNEKQSLVKLSDLIMSSVQYQIRSDVPFGVFLSGGIDSSLVTANAVNLSGIKVNTFSIGFEENKYNEAQYAKKVANYLGTQHHEFIVSYKDAIELIDQSIDAYGEPFADSSAIPTLLVSKLAKQHVTVTLSGEGGDELFFGYGSYNWAKRLNYSSIKYFRFIISKILNKFEKYQRHSNYFTYPSEKFIPDHIFSQEQNLFSIQELNELSNALKPQLKNFVFNEFYNETKHLKRKLDPIELQSLFDMQFYLPGDLLTKVDRASMQYSVETRVPFLDHRIIEFVINIDRELKIKNGKSKYLLKEILYQYIPKEYFDRPKQGFAIPLEKWMKNELNFLIEKYLNKTTIESFNVVHYPYVQKIVNEFRSGYKNHLYNRLWLLIVLHRWLSKNGI